MYKKNILLQFNYITKMQPLLILFAFIFGIIMMIRIMYAYHLCFNVSSSMPMGIYKALSSNKALHRGDIVAFCLPQKIAKEGYQRGYLLRGMCPGNESPLLKEIIALPGDTVFLTQHFVNVCGHGVYFSPILKKDPNGYHVHRWVAFGLHEHIHGYWVYGSHNPRLSWDSRYFGAIDPKKIIGIYYYIL